MASLHELVDAMVAAAKASLRKEEWDLFAEGAKEDFADLAKNILSIEADRIAGTISKEVAAKEIIMQENAVKIRVLTTRGMALLACERAVNAALDALFKGIGLKL